MLLNEIGSYFNSLISTLNARPYDWLFSGIGVTVLTVVLRTFTDLFFKRILRGRFVAPNAVDPLPNTKDSVLNSMPVIMAILNTFVIATIAYVMFVAVILFFLGGSSNGFTPFQSLASVAPDIPTPTATTQKSTIAEPITPPTVTSTPTPSPTVMPVDRCLESLDTLVVVSGTLTPRASQSCEFFLWHETAKITLLFVPNVAGPVLLEIYNQSHPTAPIAKIDEPSTIFDSSRQLSRLNWNGGQKGMSYLVKFTNYSAHEISYCLVYNDVDEWLCNAPE